MSILRKMLNAVRVLILGKPMTSESYIASLRSRGAAVGERTTIFDCKSVMIDMTRPELIEIGDDVQITHGVIILTHGYDWSVLKGISGEILGSAGKVTIGNNVFIGMNSIILKGCTVGNNVIIGAGSVVTHDIPDNSVAVGNPARVISTVDAYCEKRKAAQYDEAAQLVREYRRVHHCDPDDKVLDEFFWLFSNDGDRMPEAWDSQMRLVGNYDLSMEKFRAHTPRFSSKEEFLRSVR